MRTIIRGLPAGRAGYEAGAHTVLMGPLKTAARLLRWKCRIWLADYIRSRLFRPAPRPGEDVHVIVAIVDHFEPSRKAGAEGVKKVRQWCDRYEDIASRHTDSDGVYPQHTWFYRYDYPNFDCINILSEYAFRGLGEIEFHLHHGNDTPESFASKIREGIEWFATAGAMTAGHGAQKRFAYIAGNWALDNGRFDNALSGVDTELEILGGLGCYADFTFPAFGTVAQPRKVNSIHYSADTPEPKSYDTGVDAEVGAAASGDLMIFQGPMFIDWMRGRIECGAIEGFAPYSPERIDCWLKAGVHVKGRPQWVFIKLHTHGMQSMESFLGPGLDAMFSGLEERFKRPPYRLHYVTAREAYNIVKAAEAGMDGDAGSYRDFSIPAPANRRFFCSSPYRLLRCEDGRITAEIQGEARDVAIFFNGLDLKAMRGGALRMVDVDYASGSVRRITVEGIGACSLEYRGAEGKAVRRVDALTMPFVL